MDTDQVRQIRSFNRAVTQQVGALNEHFLGRGRPLGESRLLYEIGREGAEVRELRARLELDSGYMSRLLRSLERQGLVAGERDADDSRVRKVRLTPHGHRELRVLNKRSDAFATSILAPLSPTQRRHLTSAMAVVERLLRASSVRVAAEAPDSTDARLCLERYFEELDQRFEAGFDPATSIPAARLVGLDGIFLVARLGGQPIGCGALRVNKEGFGEIKRMWVAPDARGLGIGRRILETLERFARQRGLTTLRLDTNRVLKEAHSLYRNQGYREVEPWNDEPYAHHWFEKSL